MPDSRKVHHLPIPRTGGMVFLPVVTATIAVALVITLRLGLYPDTLWNAAVVQHFLAYLAGCMMLYSVGLFDDIHSVSYRVKFAVQVAAALLLCVSGLWIADFSHVFFIHSVPWPVGMTVTVLFVVYITNAINLIDGIDGLASGLSVIALIVIAALDIKCGHLTWAMVPAAFIGVLLAFLYYNLFGRKQKTFMGDAGSLTLGFTLAFLVLHFWQRNPVWNAQQHNIGIIALSTLTIPALDVVRVMMSRVRDRRNPFLPDKNHIHHKLMRAGLTPLWTMATILLLSVSIIVLNYLVAAISQTLIIVLDIVFFCLMHVVINIFIARREHRGIILSRLF